MKNKDTSVNQITEGVIWKQLLFFFFPIMLGTLFQQLYNTADAVVVGRFVGTRALAAVGGSTGQMVNLLVNFFVGLASGATVIIARYYGAHCGCPVCCRRNHYQHSRHPSCSLYDGAFENTGRCHRGFHYLSAYLLCRYYFCLYLQRRLCDFAGGR